MGMAVLLLRKEVAEYPDLKTTIDGEDGAASGGAMQSRIVLRVGVGGKR